MYPDVVDFLNGNLFIYIKIFYKLNVSDCTVCFTNSIVIMDEIYIFQPIDECEPLPTATWSV